MNIFFWNVPTSPMIFSQPPRHFGFFGFFLPHLRHLAAPALPPRCFAYFPFFSQTKSRRKADSHHWHLETFQKLPKIWVQEKPSKANSQNSMSVWKFSSGCSATEKTSLPGDPKHWVHSSGQQALGLGKRQGQFPPQHFLNLPTTISNSFLDSKKFERNLGELVNQNPNTSLPTPELSRQSITNLTFFWHHRTSPHLVVLVHFHQLQQLCDLTADLSSWFGLKK